MIILLFFVNSVRYASLQYKYFSLSNQIAYYKHISHLVWILFFSPESLIITPSSLSLLILFSWTSGENWVNGDYWCRTQFQYWLMEGLKGISSHLSLNKIQIDFFIFLYSIQFPFIPRTFHPSPVKTNNILNELNKCPLM